MGTILLRDKEAIEEFLRRDPSLHLYELGDLDEPDWSHTTWFVHEGGIRISSIALLYTGTALPVLLGLGDDRAGTLRATLVSILPRLPRRFYAHLSPGLDRLFLERFRVEPHGTHCRMVLREPERLSRVDTSEVTALSRSDLPDMARLYDLSYPGHWFEARMPGVGHYYGIRRNGELVCAAGVHVFSGRYRVAALGNIATLPVARGRAKSDFLSL